MIRLALVLSLIASPAFAIVCSEREDITERLDASFGEKLAGDGMAGPDVLEVWIAPDGSTWTIIVTQPSGRSCILASGTDWGRAVLAVKGDPA